MVSEHYESVDRELQMTYSAFDYMVDDRIQQKDESRKKETINLQSIVADFKQQFLDQLIRFRCDLVEMIREETNIIRSQSGPYIEDPMKSGGSSLSNISSGGSTSNDDEAVHTPDLIHCNLNVATLIGSEGIHDQVFDFTNETKSFPDLNTVTVTIEGEAEEKRESEGPTKDKRRSIGDGGSSYYLFNCGGNKSTRSSSLDGPESKKLDSYPNPDPEPPDVYCPTPNVSFSVESSTIPSLVTIGEEGGILKGNREPIGREGITNRISDIEEFEPLKDNHSTNRPEYGDLGLSLGPDPEPPDVDSSPFLAGSSKESITVASSNEKDAGIWTVSSFCYSSITNVEEKENQVQPNRHKAHVRAQNNLSPIVSHTQMNQLSPAVKIVRSISKERSQVTGIQVITNLEHVRTLNFRTTSSPCYYKTNDAINQSLTTIVFRIRPNPDPKLTSNLNSKPDLQLPKQLIRPFNTATLLFPCPSLRSIDIDQLLSTRSLLGFLSYPLTQSSKRILNWYSNGLADETVQQKDRYAGFRVWALYLFSISSRKFEYGPSAKPANKLRVLQFAEAVTRLLMRNLSIVLFWKCLGATCSPSLVDICVSSLWASNRILPGEATVISNELQNGPVILANSFERRTILLEYFKLVHEGYKEYVYKVVFDLTHHRLPLKKILEQHAHLWKAHKKLAKARLRTVPKVVVWFMVLVGSNLVNTTWSVECLSMTWKMKIGGLTFGSRKVWARLFGEGKSMGDKFNIKKITYLYAMRDEDIVLVWGCHKVIKYLVWECINGGSCLMEFMKMAVKLKLAAELDGVKTAQDEDDILLWSSADYSKHETKLIERFQVAGLGIKAGNTHIHGEDDVIGQQQLLYFFYPP